MGAGWLATILDQEMIEGGGGAIAARSVRDGALPARTGAEVAAELRGRLLARYMLRSQIGEFAGGSTEMHWVTPTPLSTKEIPRFLAVPRPAGRRTHAVLLDPAPIPEIRGPRWVKTGQGIEYLLPNGFPASALVMPWEIEVR
jgi:hypothetical protein